MATNGKLSFTIGILVFGLIGIFLDTSIPLIAWVSLWLYDRIVEE